MHLIHSQNIIYKNKFKKKNNKLSINKRILIIKHHIHIATFVFINLPTYILNIIHILKTSRGKKKKFLHSVVISIFYFYFIFRLFFFIFFLFVCYKIDHTIFNYTSFLLARVIFSSDSSKYPLSFYPFTFISLSHPTPGSTTCSSGPLTHHFTHLHVMYRSPYMYMYLYTRLRYIKNLLIHA